MQYVKSSTVRRSMQTSGEYLTSAMFLSKPGLRFGSQSTAHYVLKGIWNASSGNESTYAR